MKKVKKFQNIEKEIKNKSDSKFSYLINKNFYDFHIYYLNGYNLEIYLFGKLDKAIYSNFSKNKKDLLGIIKNITTLIKEK